jgi:hypothetical protein
MKPHYETDFYSWAKHNAQLLRDGQAGQADLANIAEELDDMGGSKERELENRLGILLAHLLKWRYQRGHRGNSWIATIKEQRRRVKRVLQKNPGLKSYLNEAFEYAYGDARLIAARETGFEDKRFPADCPFTQAQAMDEEFWPE